jgi:hypothetical protein
MKGYVAVFFFFFWSSFKCEGRPLWNYLWDLSLANHGAWWLYEVDPGSCDVYIQHAVLHGSFLCKSVYIGIK